MKAFIYCRVSSQRQVDEGHGLEGQEKRCRDYARTQGYEVVAVFKDEGVSGGMVEREGMQALLSRLEAYGSDENESIVIIDDIKRFARDVQGHFTLKTAIYSRNARLESPSHRFEETPEGKFVETVLAGAAELERNQNKKQVVNRMKARLESGYWPFMPPLGLINRKDPVHGKILTAKEPEASLLKKAIEKFRDGLLASQEDVKSYLEEEFKKASIETKPPTLSTIPMILKNPLYAGYIEYGHWSVPFIKARHEGFISLDTYNRVQMRLQNRSKPWKRKDYSIDFPLRPHVLCDACGKPMTASWNKGRKERYPNYFCRAKYCEYRWKVTRKDKLEGQFEALLSRVKPANGLMVLAKEVLQEQWEDRLERHAERRARVVVDMDEAGSAIKSYLQLIRATKDGDLKAIYEKELKDFLSKKKEAEQKLNEKEYTNEEFGTALEKVFGVLNNPMPMWKSSEYDDKRTILFMYFEEQLRFDYNRGFGTANLAYPVKLIASLGQAKNGSVEMSGRDPESEKVK